MNDPSDLAPCRNSERFYTNLAPPSCLLTKLWLRCLGTIAPAVPSAWNARLPDCTDAAVSISGSLDHHTLLKPIIAVDDAICIFHPKQTARDKIIENGMVLFITGQNLQDL